MAEKKQKKISIKDLFKKKQVIIGSIAVVVIVVICIVALLVNGTSKSDSKNKTATQTQAPTETPKQTKKPITLPSTDSSVSAESVDTQTSDNSVNASETQSTPAPQKDEIEKEFEEVMGASNDEAARAALEKKEQTDANQVTFDSYIDNKDYKSAYDLLENFFKDNSYANNSLATYKNYVTYYENQGLYNESIAFQLDYIDQKDGLENVRQESVHYQTLVKSLEHVPDYQDSRLATINESVATWKAMTDAINNGDYTTVINTTKDYIKNGKESVTAYLYLTEALKAKGDRFEEAKVYYCYLGLDDENVNQLEMSYYSLFLNNLTRMYYNDTITNEELEYIENDFDYTNYLKQ